MTELRMIQINSFFFILILGISNGFSEQVIEQIGPPWGYEFNNWGGPAIDIIVYFPPESNFNTPLLIVVPGASRDAQRFHASWLDLAKKKHFAVLTIGAKKDFFPDEYSYNAGGVLTEKGYSVHEDKWLFSAIVPIFEDFKVRYGSKIKKFYLFGHSAGGGFVHRDLLLKPEAPVVRAVSANPAFVTLPSRKEIYPFGLKNAPVRNYHIQSWFNHNMAIVLGANDLGPRTKPLSNSSMAKSQGANCLERGKLLFKSAESSAKQSKLEFQWELIIVPDVGHDNYNIAPQSCNYLFGK